MSLLAVSGSARLSTHARLVAFGTVLAAVAAPVSVAATTTFKPCPSAAVVNSALGQKNKAPVSTSTAYSKTCTYKGSGLVHTRITFQVDTAASFAAGEKAAGAVGPLVKLHGLGRAAWAPKAGGGLFVFDGKTTLKIVSPLTSLSKLEALARKIL